MSDLKMQCPSCQSWTNSVGQAAANGEQCPYCGAALTVEQVNSLLGVNLWGVRSFRADVRIDFDEHGRVLATSLLNPDHADTP